MRIVHLADYFQPALGYQEAALAREQLRLGHDVTVVTSDRYAPFEDYARTVQPVLGERIRGPGQGVELGIPVWRMPVWGERSFRCWLKGLRGALRELQPEVVHAHCVVRPATWQAARLKPKLGYRLLIDDHMHRVVLRQSWGGRVFYGLFRRFVAPLISARADALVAITEETATIVQEVFGLKYPPVRVIELGVDSERFAPSEEARREQRHRLKLNPEDFLVIYTGKLVSAKAPHWLLEALPHCPAGVKILLVGNAAPDYRRKLDRLIDDHRLQGRVLFQPAVEQAELPRFYAGADAGCWPREASMAMLEASACALPIIIAEGGLSERVAFGNGMEYPEGNVQELACCIGRLVGNRGEARRMGMQGRQLVQERYSWGRINEQFMAAYQG